MSNTVRIDEAFEIRPALSEPHRAYLARFAGTRRVQWSPQAEEISDALREAAGLPFGKQGEFFVAINAEEAQSHRCIQADKPPSRQPGRWCGWQPNKQGDGLFWDGNDGHVEWLEYLVRRFLVPWNYQLSGRLQWQGEQDDDFGTIEVDHGNVLVTAPADDAAEDLAVALRQLREGNESERRDAAESIPDAIADANRGLERASQALLEAAINDDSDRVRLQAIEVLVELVQYWDWRPPAKEIGKLLASDRPAVMAAARSLEALVQALE